MTPWRDAVEDLGGGVRAAPSWERGDVPACAEDCVLYDGKRCRATGFRPSSICEPVVERMAELLSELRPARKRVRK